MNEVFKPYFKKTLWVGFFLILGLFLIFPLVRLLIFPYLHPDRLQFLERLLVSSSLLKSLKNTFIFSTATTALSVVVGTFWAWIITRTDLPFRKTFKTFLSLPYAIPPFIGAISWIYLANPSNGLLNQILGVGRFNIYSLAGLIFVETCFLYTFVFLAVSSALEQMDASFEEAARLSGADPLNTFFKVTLPLVWPAVINSALLVFLAALASFGVPALIGGPAGLKVITTEIFQLQKIGTSSGLQSSLMLSGFLLLFSVALIVLLQTLKGRKKMNLVSGKSSRKSLMNLKKEKFLILGFLILFLFIVLGGPFIGVFLSATSKVQGILSFENFSFIHFYRVLFQTDEVLHAIKNSLLISATVAFLTSLVSLLVGYYQTQIKNYKAVDILISLPYSVPGTIIALSLIVSFSQSFFGLPFTIYNTIWLFVIAFFIKYLDFSAKMITDNYKQIHAHLIEAAQVAGARPLQIFTSIWLPLLRPSLIASFFLVFVPCLSELTMSLFLTGPGLETIGTLIYQMQEYSDNIGGGAAVLSCVVFVIVIFINYFVKVISKGKYGL